METAGDGRCLRKALEFWTQTEGRGKRRTEGAEKGSQEAYWPLCFTSVFLEKAGKKTSLCFIVLGFCYCELFTRAVHT